MFPVEGSDGASIVGFRPTEGTGLVCMYVCIPVYVCACMHACMYVRLPVCMYVCMYVGT